MSSNGKRFLGLDLGGSKSKHTCLVLLECFKTSKSVGKIFLSKAIPKILASSTQCSDEVLLHHIHTLNPHTIGVNVPLQLPPCLECTLSHCPGFQICEVEEVKWMHNEAQRMGEKPQKFPTPYTQRAGDVYLRSRVQPHFSFDLFIEEAMGSRAPLTSRMKYLKRHLSSINFTEVYPRITLLGLAPWFSIPQRLLSRYRDLDDGKECRLQILNHLEKDVNKLPHLFLYDTDKETLSQDLNSFYALLNALMPIYQDWGFATPLDRDYNHNWGNVAVPSKSLPI